MMTMIAATPRRRRKRAEPPPEQPPAYIELDNISWETYERLLEDTAEQHIRITYDQGRMVLMSPRPEHERAKRLIGRLIETGTLERNIPLASLGSTTWRKRKKLVGLEADECYYIQNEPKVRGRDDIDLRRDPPPDLAIEVNITHNPPGKQSIYAALGVSEVWRYNGERVEFLLLGKDRKYTIVRRSRQLPFLTSEDVTRFVKMSRTTDENSVIRAFIEWLSKNAQS